MIKFDIRNFDCRIACAAAVLVMSAGIAPAAAQQVGPGSLAQSGLDQWGLDQWGLDPQALVVDGQALLLRAPDPSIDGLFRAVHASSRQPHEAQALCALFDPQADRSLAGLNATASQLGQASRERFANAVAGVFIAAAQSQPRPFDEPRAQQLLKAAGVRAMLLDDGFMAGLNGGDSDARCHSIGSLLDVLEQRPLEERAAVTRLLLSQGLNMLALTQDAPHGGETGDHASEAAGEP